MIQLRWKILGSPVNGERVLQFRALADNGDWGPWTDVPTVLDPTYIS